MAVSTNKAHPGAIYTPEQRRRRDASIWTLVQAVLAPLQFMVFIVSLALVVRFFVTGAGELLAASSIVAKTAVLYTIMVTGAWWEKDVFGQYLFAEPFYWEDVVSMAVMVLHTGYVVMLIGGFGSPATQFVVALVAYACYVVNAAQFFWKFRLARRHVERTVPRGLGAT
ncbi:MAG: 2-vinyl bacteriochlorophyllide hydratase [Pseudomonadota bacterium]